jgi:prepilin-type N-terminal cleavage/methylation domain-containing protein
LRRAGPETRRARGARGFSLVEIAIVLAVIGALVAAVLVKGGAVFGRANTASLLANIKDLAAESRDFKARYSYFPGDLPNAGTYIAGVSGGCSYAPGGDVGNGIVNTETESDCALEHLVKAGMLAKADYDGSRYVIANSGVRVSLWSADSLNVVRISNVPCDVALEIDRKLDSASTGNTPFTEGSVRAAAGIQTCVPASTNDPVTALLIRY